LHFDLDGSAGNRGVALQRLTEPSFRVAIHVRKGTFHKWLGKKPDSPVTTADIAKGKA
jgi:hypothetical protein